MTAARRAAQQLLSSNNTRKSPTTRGRLRRPATTNNGRTMTTMSTNVGASEARRPRRFALALAVLPMMAVACSGGSDSGASPTVAVTNPAPVETEPATEPPSTEAPLAQDVAITADESSVDLAALAAVGDQLTTAWAVGDRSAATELVDDNATVNIFGAHDRDEFGLLFGWFAATDWHFKFQECVAAEPNQVKCTVLQSNAWSDAVDLESVESSLFLNVENGQATDMRYQLDSETWPEFVFRPFFRFVEENHADDVDSMWATTSDGFQISGPILTDSSSALFEQYSTEYATFIAEGRASTTTMADGGS
jgi:hypothetical protein